MIGRIARRAMPGAVALLLLLAPAAAPAQGAPPWTQRLMPWETHAGQPRPWRDDARLAGRSEPGYPDDFPVYFANPEFGKPGKLHEVMWVRTIAFDPATDLYLGILINQPDYVSGLAVGDNVVFRAVPGLTAPATAVGGPAYADAGWPQSREPAFFATLRDGIRAYRNGHEGHVMPEIERCIRVLAPAVVAMPAGASRDERFVANYVLGRCRDDAEGTAPHRCFQRKIAYPTFRIRSSSGFGRESSFASFAGSKTKPSTCATPSLAMKRDFTIASSSTNSRSHRSRSAADMSAGSWCVITDSSARSAMCAS